MQDKRVKTALIGTGNMGRKYAQMIVENKTNGLELAAAVCRSDEAYEWGRSLGGFELYRSVDELYRHEDSFDAVIIVTPHKTHPQLALQAFEHGKHVMCDKPAGVTVKDALQMSAAADEKKLVYGLMFHQRMRPEYIKLKNMTDNGEFGTIHRVQMVNTRYFRTKAYHKSSPWRSTLEGEGGGALINQGQHILDIWQWLFGVPDELQSLVMTGKYNDFDVEDEAYILMRYKNGMTGSFIISTAEGMAEEKLVISGSKKYAVLDGGELYVGEFSEDTDGYRTAHSCFSREELKIDGKKLDIRHISDSELYIKMLDNFASAITRGDKLHAAGSEGVNSLILTNGAYISERNKCRIKTADLLKEEI